MPECHKCKYDGKGLAVCLTCKLSTGPNNKGRSHVSLDAGNRDLVMRYSLDPPEQESLKLDDCCLDAVMSVLKSLQDMDDDDLSIIMAIIRGESLSQWARSRNLTRAAASWRIMRIAQKNKALSFLRPCQF